VWTRLIRADGSSIVRLPVATDAPGRTDLEDRVGWHWGAGAAVSTVIGVGAELAAPDRVDADGRIAIATREGAQDTVNQVGQQTLTVRVGYLVRVLLNRDLVLAEKGER
jgi:type IV secretory pathway VirB10-like protein